MEFKDALNYRRSIRDFSDRPLAKETIKEIIADARRAPSWVNSQPWEVYVATGKTLETIKELHLELSQRGLPGNSDLPFMHRDKMSPLARQNAGTWSQALQTFLGADAEQMGRSQITLFNAPALVYLTLPKNTSEWSIYDLGAFGQTLMLAAADRKVDSMPAWEIVKYPSVVKNIMQIPDDKQLVMGIALGYRDQATKINGFYTERSKVDNFLTFKD